LRASQHGAGEKSFISDALLDESKAPDGHIRWTPRKIAQKLLSPERYHERWRFKRQDGSHGGIPLEELQASAVQDPAPDGKLWLLHQKAFRDESGNVDATRKVPICRCCQQALSGLAPRMPKYALANDLWMGRMPPALRDLSVGAWMLLPLARALIRRYNCFNDSGKHGPADQRIKAYIGNVCAFPQADGGKLVTSFPPREEDVIDHLLIAFAGQQGDLKKAFIKELGVNADKFRAAYEFLRSSKALYSRVEWDAEAAKWACLVYWLRASDAKIPVSVRAP